MERLSKGYNPDPKHLTPDELADHLETRGLTEAINRERQKTQGVTDRQLEADADAFLKAHGFGNLIDPKLR